MKDSWYDPSTTARSQFIVYQSLPRCTDLHFKGFFLFFSKLKNSQGSPTVAAIWSTLEHCFWKLKPVFYYLTFADTHVNKSMYFKLLLNKHIKQIQIQGLDAHILDIAWNSSPQYLNTLLEAYVHSHFTSAYNRRPILPAQRGMRFLFKTFKLTVL